jgi:hypothetical protein
LISSLIFSFTADAAAELSFSPRHTLIFHFAATPLHTPQIRRYLVIAFIAAITEP